MTKYVRIENADTSQYKVVIEVYEKAPPSVGGPDKLVSTLRADYPTEMVREYLTSTRYIVIKEDDEATS